MQKSSPSRRAAIAVGLDDVSIQMGVDASVYSFLFS